MAMRTVDEVSHDPKRRRFLRGGLLLATHPRALLAPAVGVFALLWSKSASAEPVTVCLALASVVFDAIKARNASDGGMSAMQKASLDYQRVISNQLSSVQQGIAEVLQRLGTIAAAVDDNAEQVSLKQMHVELSSASHQYLSVIARAHRSYASYQEWIEAADVQNELEQIAIVLNRNFAVADSNHRLGPTSALYLAASTHTLLAIKFAQGRSPNPPKLRRFSNFSDSSSCVVSGRPS